jgi:hypothetical protein
MYVCKGWAKIHPGPCTVPSKNYCASSCSSLRQSYTSDEVQNFPYGGRHDSHMVPWFPGDEILNILLSQNHIVIVKH